MEFALTYCGADDKANEANLETITFQASVYKVSTLTDGGVRVSLDLPETAIMQMAMLAECQRAGIYLDVVCTDSNENWKKTQENGRKRA